MNTAILTYHIEFEPEYQLICQTLHDAINIALPDAESKIWHAHPVWFLDGNPIVGYSLQKRGIRLMFWSGADFNEEALNTRGVKFKDASIFYNQATEIDQQALMRWMKLARNIQWDYKNLIKNKGVLNKIKPQ